MDKEYFTELTNDIYRLTLLFPKKEPLRYKLRESAGAVLEDLIMILEGDSTRYDELTFRIKKNVGLLDTLLNVAREQNWVSEDELSKVQEKYHIIKEEIENFEGDEDEEYKSEPKREEREKEKLTIPTLNYQKENPIVVLTSRQEKIVELLKKREKVQIKDTHAILPEITKRTLRRDFDALMKSGIVKRIGKANTTFYKLADKEA